MKYTATVAATLAALCLGTSIDTFAAPSAASARGTEHTATPSQSAPTTMASTQKSPTTATSPATQTTTTTTRGPSKTGQPSQSCEDLGNQPGNSMSAPGSAFNPSGTAGGVYAGEQPQNSRNTASVSQYDVACARPAK